MNPDMLQNIVAAVLYEGYVLYPYRPSSKKNRRERFTFGRVYPEAYSVEQEGAEPCVIQTECLVKTSTSSPVLNVSIGFLHPMAREVAVAKHAVGRGGSTEFAFTVVPELWVGDELFQTWQEAVERKVQAPEIKFGDDSPIHLALPFSFSETRTSEPIGDGGNSRGGMILRRQEKLEGVIEVSVEPLGARLHKVTVQIMNHTPVPAGDLNDPDAILMRTFASAHAILNVRGGEFISLMDPPADCKEAAESCKNVGTWPVFVGDESRHETDTMLSSPIILYDYPIIAPESAGPLFDGTEIDEILTLRILTMTDGEKLEMSRIDEHARRLLERTENLSEDALLKMHGIMRKAESSKEIEFDDFFGASTRLKGVSVGGIYLKAGDRVRLRPKARADVIDLALSGQTAVIEAVEEDMEKRVHVAVVLDNDPGKDLGLLRQPGHRFFYAVDEIEPLKEELR